MQHQRFDHTLALNQRFDHTLALKMTSEMRDDIDQALILVQDCLIRTRSEFLRATCQYALDGLASGCGDIPISVEERKAPVLSGADELDADRTYQVGVREPPRLPAASLRVTDFVFTWGSC
jgi:hypothetical protein